MREVTSGASLALLIKVAAAIATFALSVALGKAVGAAGTGVYFFTFTIVSVAAVAGRLGLDNVVVRYMAGARAEGNWSRVHSVHRDALWLTVVASGLLTLTVIGAAPLFGYALPAEPDTVAALRIMSLAIVPTAIAAIYAQSLQALKRIPAAMAVRSLWARVLTLVGVVAFGAQQGPTGAAAAFLAASILTAAIGAVHWRTATRARERRDGHQRVAVSELLRSGIPLLSATLMHMMPTVAPTFLLGLWEDSAEVGMYAVAQRLAFLPGLLLIAVNSIVAPMFAGFYQNRDMASLERVARGAASLMAVVALPFVAALVLLPGSLLAMIGDDFRGGAAVLAVLAIGQYLNIATGSVGCVLMMTGRERVIRNITAGAAVANVVLCLVLIPAFGILGAAVATAIAMGGQNIVAAVAVSRSLGISTLPIFGRAVHQGDGIP
jgi:O-antigen/teichoic acid export membrane protein